MLPSCHEPSENNATTHLNLLACIYSFLAAVTLYSNCEFDGNVIPGITPGKYNAASNPELTGILTSNYWGLSSLKFPPTLEVVLYTGANFDGPSLTVTSSDHNAVCLLQSKGGAGTSGTFNDGVQSFIVTVGG